MRNGATFPFTFLLYESAANPNGIPAKIQEIFNCVLVHRSHRMPNAVEYGKYLPANVYMRMKTGPAKIW